MISRLTPAPRSSAAQLWDILTAAPRFQALGGNVMAPTGEDHPHEINPPYDS
ncbi:hypothetical protein [Roseinatronobacter thiooxidans]|uniref:hypothetical protein n=1 Tax=Roseinatronobacter thiooxidans TaxID=121821 RepID=UPI0014759CB9|nr:hypothetical protein [Roseinatronobacter thiooxidans]